jgi:drug/metabolite transporter (DMT)-like permease
LGPARDGAERPLWAVHLGLLLTALIWGGNYVVLKVALRSVGPLALTFVRFAFLCGFSLALLARAGLDPVRPFTRREVALAAAAGLCGYLVNPLAFTLGIDRTSAFSSAVLSSTTPLFSALGLGLFGLERVSRRQWLGTAVAFAGVVAFVGQGAGRGLAFGDLLSLGSGLAFAAYGLLNKPVLANHRPTRVLALCLVAGGLPLLAVCLPAALAEPWGRVTPATWGLIAYATLLSILLGHFFWNWAIARVGVARTVPYAYLSPILAGVCSAALLGEPFGPLKVAGAGAVLLGLILTTLPARHGAAPPLSARTPSR